MAAVRGAFWTAVGALVVLAGIRGLAPSLWTPLATMLVVAATARAFGAILRLPPSVRGVWVAYLSWTVLMAATLLVA